MTNRECMLAIMAGKMPDRIPWIPRLLLWYNAHQKAGTLPARYRNWSLRDIERDLGLGTPARDGAVFRTELQGVEIEQHWLDDMRRASIPRCRETIRSNFALARGLS